MEVIICFILLHILFELNSQFLMLKEMVFKFYRIPSVVLNFVAKGSECVPLLIFLQK